MQHTGPACEDRRGVRATRQPAPCRLDADQPDRVVVERREDPNRIATAADAGDHHRRQAAGLRSEEHTSELQSHVNLVCRLLLEKKKNIYAQRKLRLKKVKVREL